AERFGILTLAWALIGYFSLFEFGLSRALTQGVAQRLGNGQSQELAGITQATLAILVGLGVVGAAIVAVVTPLLVKHVLNVSPSLVRETMTAFIVLAVSLPLVVSSAGLRGIIEAHQHFGVATALRLPLVAFMFLGPLLVLPFTKSLVAAVAMLVIGRAVAWLAYLLFCIRKY